MSTFTESTVEQAVIDWLKELGYYYAFGPEIAFDGVVCVVKLRGEVDLYMLKSEEITLN
jgi:hypothetical protein